MSAEKANRKRSVHFHFWANEEEAALINERLAASGIVSFGAFARKMLIDGYHVNIDLSDVREMVSLLRRSWCHPQGALRSLIKLHTIIILTKCDC